MNHEIEQEHIFVETNFGEKPEPREIPTKSIGTVARGDIPFTEAMREYDLIRSKIKSIVRCVDGLKYMSADIDGKFFQKLIDGTAELTPELTVYWYPLLILISEKRTLENQLKSYDDGTVRFY
jgi:hypothetical protein